MNLKDFAKYLHYKSFNKELHKIRQKSNERVMASEAILEKEINKFNKGQTKKSA